MRRRLAALLMVAALLAPAPAAIAAACPRTSVAALENQVMCLVCGVPLALADAPQAQRERALIGRLVRRCESAGQIKQALVAQYGPAVLALPADEGFRLAAYLVPALVALAAALGLGLVVTRVRGRPRATPRPAPTGALDPLDAARLDAELDGYRGV